MMGALALSLSSCARVAITDKTFCVDQGTLGAHCANTLSIPTKDIPQPDWDNLRFGQFCTLDPQDNLGGTFSQMKKELEELCSYCNCCDYPTMDAIRQFFERAAKMQQQMIVPTSRSAR